MSADKDDDDNTEDDDEETPTPMDSIMANKRDFPVRTGEPDPDKTFKTLFFFFIIIIRVASFRHTSSCRRAMPRRGVSYFVHQFLYSREEPTHLQDVTSTIEQILGRTVDFPEDVTTATDLFREKP